MQISFFEEFPNRKNLSKLKLINWPTKIYLATESLDEFNIIQSKIKKNKNINQNIKELIYWPILKRKEGYWISPFSSRKALLRIFSELNNQPKKISVMLDLELPTTRNPFLYFSQSWNFLKNKKLIKHFIQNYTGTIYLAEYCPKSIITKNLMLILGLHYSNSKIKIIRMLYHSIHKFSQEFLIQEILNGKKEFGNNYLISYGCLQSGILGNEQVLDLNILKLDLETARKEKINEIVLFRLGGLNKKYAKIIRTITTN